MLEGRKGEVRKVSSETLGKSDKNIKRSPAIIFEFLDFLHFELFSDFWFLVSGF